MTRDQGREKDGGLERDDIIFAEFASYYINLISNRLSRGSSRLYFQLFGIGIIEWRTMGYLGGRTGCTAIDVSGALGLDKAAISRAVRALELKDLVRTEPLGRRRIGLVLTSKGRALYKKILPLAVARQELLLSRLTKLENRQLIELLKKVEGNLEELGRHDSDLTQRGANGK
jgi:DNA-binding MarR family transcriptional regulator